MPHQIKPTQVVRHSQAKVWYLKMFIKNSIPSVPLNKMPFASEKDALGKHGRQMLHVWSSVQREYHHKLYILWQSRGENCKAAYDENLISYFKSKARLCIMYSRLCYFFQSGDGKQMPQKIMLGQSFLLSCMKTKEINGTYLRVYKVAS